MSIPELPDWSPNNPVDSRFTIPAPLVAGAAFAAAGGWNVPAIPNPLAGGGGANRPWAQNSGNPNSRGHLIDLIANALAPRVVHGARKRSTYLSGATFNFANVVPTFAAFDGQQWSSAETAVTRLLDRCWHPLTADGGMAAAGAVGVEFYYMAGPGPEVYGGILTSPAEFGRATGAAGFAASAANVVAWPVTLWAILVARITPPGGGAAVLAGFGWRCLNVHNGPGAGCDVTDITTLTAAIGFDPLPGYPVAMHPWRTVAANPHYGVLPNAAAHCNGNAACTAAVGGLPAVCGVAAAPNVMFQYPGGVAGGFPTFRS